jgi:16S rRNA (adenine1518-N6/adenine1519-N6)-dimethyltransferase
MRKRFGQHLLKNRSIAQRIVELAELTPYDSVLEIGPGKGILTIEILKKGARLLAIEIDKGFSLYLNDLFAGNKNFTLIEGDCLGIDWEEEIFSKIDKRLKVISNLPYYLTAPLIFKLFEWRKKISLIILTMQLEVAKRIVAMPSTKDYGILSIASQFFTYPSIAFKIQPGSFIPPPKVTSACIKMRVKKDGEFYLKDEARFFRMVRTLFNKRRKMITNTIKELKDVENGRLPLALVKAGIDGRRRPETLSLDEFRNLYNAIYE